MVYDIRDHRKHCSKSNKRSNNNNNHNSHHGQIKCHDCNEIVSNLEDHRKTCSKSRQQKSLVTSQYNSQGDVQQTNSLEIAQKLKSGHNDIYVLIDVSGSMGGQPLENCKNAVNEIFNRMDDKDRLSILTFDTNAYFKLKPRPVHQIKVNNELNEILSGIYAKNMTAFYDSMYTCISEIRDKNANSQIYVLTDTMDNSSKHTLQDVLNLAKEYPNIKLNIIHIGQTNENDIYKTMCVENNGKYRQSTYGDIISTCVGVYVEINVEINVKVVDVVNVESVV